MNKPINPKNPDQPTPKPGLLRRLGRAIKRTTNNMHWSDRDLKTGIVPVAW
jgi:hypothetical protein